MSNKAESRAALIDILQNAYAGELAAALAYDGHWRSVKCLSERQKILQIQEEEHRHRRCIATMLHELDIQPDPARERRSQKIGTWIARLCKIGSYIPHIGWYAAMYGAGRLERPNIKEYEDAARHAAIAGEWHIIGALLSMAEVEWDHELYFREKVQSHCLRFLLPAWSSPAARTTIRSSFQTFCTDHGLAEWLGWHNRPDENVFVDEEQVLLPITTSNVTRFHRIPSSTNHPV